MSTPAENRKLWVDALRSGEFEQALGRLRVDNQFCCLGVACEVHRCETGDGTWLEENSFQVKGVTGTGVLPSPVVSWLGLTTGTGKYGAAFDEQTSLADLNDDGLSFSEIADVIEAEPEGLLAA